MIKNYQQKNLTKLKLFDELESLKKNLIFFILN